MTYVKSPPAICALLLWTLAVPVHVQAASVADNIQQDLLPPRTFTKSAGGEPLYFPELLAQFYAARRDAPVWVSDDAPLPVAQTMLEAVRASYEDGLRPDDYHLPALDRLINGYRHAWTRSGHQQKLAVLDVLMSDAFLQLAADEMYGRTVATAADTVRSGQRRCRGLLDELRKTAAGADPAALLRTLAPQDPEYQAMRAALSAYRALDAKGGLPEVTTGAPLRLGDSGPRVAALILHLESEGDLAEGGAQGSQYDSKLRFAVKQFQSRHGLNADGIAGSATLALVNESAAAVVNQLRVNMDRLRRLPRHLPGTRLLVNVADFRATLFVENKPVLAAKVIVGQPGRQTPEFNDWIRYLVVNPSWDVPPSIAGEEILPKVQHDPGYLARHGYQVLQGWGENEHPVDPASIDWKRWTKDDLPYHFWQEPGRENPLGRIKFMFPNRYDIYLHDTPARNLFGASQCTFSHGCIRVAHAMQLAAALLRLDGREYPDKLLADAVAGGNTQRLDLRHPVPIYIVYLTAWADTSGVLEFRRDFYARDPQVLSALNAPVSRNLPCLAVSYLH